MDEQNEPKNAPVDAKELTDLSKMIYVQFSLAQEKYAYFILTAAGAGIALVVHQTADATLRLSMSLLAMAVILWLVSFYCGCRFVQHRNAVMQGNQQFLELAAHKMRTHSDHGADDSEVVNLFAKELKNRDANMTEYGRWQFWGLVYGALFYVGWHVWEMVMRSLE